MLQKDAKASQQAIKLLAELEMEQDLKLKAEERSMALQQRVDQDVKAIVWLCRE